MKIGILQFLGTNCDRDVGQAVEQAGGTVRYVWFQDSFSFDEFAALIIPGGFSYGDYLRCGALAAKAPVMKSVRTAAENGLPILGICNGFQILCEAGLLPGVLLRNESGRFIDRWVNLKTATKNPFFASATQLRLPIAHGEGRYFIGEQDLPALYEHDQVWLTYADNNPNGSIAAIAGVTNKAKNVVGLMPHPERAVFDWLGGTDGCEFFSRVCR